MVGDLGALGALGASKEALRVSKFRVRIQLVLRLAARSHTMKRKPINVLGHETVG